MCGFCGFINPATNSNSEQLHSIVNAMSERILHRGPDAGGAWTDTATGVALGHRRLSILDLSSAGHQPMHSANQRFMIAFNGEIYNFAALRSQLQAQYSITWRGHSDTEVLLEAIAAWGLAQTLKKLVGMFAFALWDREQRTLSLARDRMGEKPLYYGMQQGALLFASELKALKAHPAWQGVVDRNALTQLLRHNYVGSPLSIYQGIAKLPPGSYLQISALAASLPSPISYWSLADIAYNGQQQRFDGTDAQAIKVLEQHLHHAVADQMVADVPLGAFLSGGYDSTTVVALMQAQSTRPVKTFAIGFHESGFNEAQYAQQVAQHLGTEHTELYVTPEDVMQVIPELPTIYDEPFADPSQMPTYLVAKLAKQQVTVALSGDGGDELFAGYQRYFQTQHIWNQLRLLPGPARKLCARVLAAIPVSYWNHLLQYLGFIHPAFRAGKGGDKLHKLLPVFAVGGQHELYQRLMTQWPDPAAVVIGGHEPHLDLGVVAPLAEDIEQMMLLDGMHYLPDDILVKVDRAAMAVSLETRIPLLDHRLVEFAWQLPLSMKTRGGQGKWLLRQVLYQYVPQSMMDRPKMGFAVPLSAWLRGPLRDWGESLLDASTLQQQGYFDVAAIRQKWQEHLSGQREWHYYLWDVLMFQAWLQQQ